MEKIIIFYDNWCPNCTRFAKFVNRWNGLGLVEVKKLRDNLHIRGLNANLAIKKMASKLGNKWFYGYLSLFLIFCRLPLLWVFVPLLWLLKVTKLGDIVYNQLAVNRKIIPLHCNNKGC